jgi:putative hydrolase of the HAD superfamily
MTQYRKGLVLDFGGVLTTPLLPAALAFERSEGLPEGTLLTGLYLDPEGIRLTEELERGTVTQTEWNEAAAGLLGIRPDNLMGRVFADLRPQPSVRPPPPAGPASGSASSPTPSVRRPGTSTTVTSWRNATTPWCCRRSTERASPNRRSSGSCWTLGLSAEECVFVDDTEQYLPPAAELGFATVHAVEPARTVAALETLLGVPLTDKEPGSGHPLRRHL